MSSDDKKKVVIVGAGVGARCVMQAIPKLKRSSLSVTLVQPNVFSEMPWYCTSEITDKMTFEDNATTEPVPGVDETVYGVAVACGDGVVAVKPLEEGKDPQLVSFDILVCSTGISLPSILSTPGQSVKDRKAEVERLTETLSTATQHVVIGGGGHIGVELAGDTIEEWPPDARTGSLVLVCSTERLLPDRPAKYGEKALAKLEQLGCKVILNDRVVHERPHAIGEITVLELQSGKTLECDAYLPAYNRGPNTQWLAAGLPDGSSPLPQGILNDKNQVVVDDYLASTAYPKLYAIGATNSRGEACVGMNTQNQSKTVAANILSPSSKKHSPGPIKFPVYQTIGHKTYAFLSPEAVDYGNVIMKWCGFPCNLLCPCFLCGVICGPLTPMCCGYCCAEPEGKGFIHVLEKAHEMEMPKKMIGYPGLGDWAPVPEAEMDRF